jgi:hypothetical protein
MRDQLNNSTRRTGVKSLIMVLALGGALGSVGASAEPTLSVGSASVGVGGATTVDLSISGLTPGPALGAFDVTLSFNPSLLGLKSETFGDPVLGGDQLDPEGFGVFSNVITGSGSVELQDLSFDDSSALTSLQPSSFTLGTLTFNALAAGTSALTASNVILSDPSGSAISAITDDGTLTVMGSGTTPPASAPEIDPASAASGLTLLLGMLAVIRGRRKAPA